MNRYLLQQDIQFFAQPDPAQTRIVVIVFGALVLIGVIAALVNRQRGKGGGGGGAGLARQGRKLGLSSDQRKVLKELSRSLGLQNPQRLLSNSAYMNHAMRRRIDQLDASSLPEAERERQKSLLFSIKRAIENSQKTRKVLPSSRQLRVGQNVHVRAPEGFEQESLIASNVHNGLGIDLPFERRGKRTSVKKGSPVQVSFVDDSHRHYAFRSRVIGFNNARGASVMFVEHASNIPQTQKRRSPRREYDRPCYFYPVTVLTTGKGRKQKTQAFVNKNRRIFGHFEDLSAGGCAIRTQVPFPKGDILKIDFEYTDGTPLSVYGMVRSVERQRARGRLMHIKFTRVSRKNLNQIQSYVYGLTE